MEFVYIFYCNKYYEFHSYTVMALALAYCQGLFENFGWRSDID